METTFDDCASPHLPHPLGMAIMAIIAFKKKVLSLSKWKVWKILILINGVLAKCPNGATINNT